MTNVVPIKPKERQRKTRETVLDLLDKYADNFSVWLDEIANGKPTMGSDGKPQFDSQGNRMVQTKGDPLTAAKLYLELLEFGVPKLARTEHTGKDGGPVVVRADRSDLAL